MGDALSGDTITFAATLNGKTIVLDNGLDVAKSLTIEGPGAQLLTISGNHKFPVFEINIQSEEIGSATISGVTITAGKNSGIENYDNLTLTNCTISGNYSSYGGGGIANLAGATLTLNNSTVSGNSTAASDAYNVGGGIYNRGTAILNNSTVSGNYSATAGGIHNLHSLTLNNSTVSGNSAYAYGGGIYNESTLVVTNSIVSGNIHSNMRLGEAEDDIQGTFTNSGGNIIGETAAEIRLSPLANNGGATQTMAPLSDSPALNAGKFVSSEQATDQRGDARPHTVGAVIDAGAVQITGNASTDEIFADGFENP